MPHRSLRVRASSAVARAFDTLPDPVKVALSGRRPIVIDGQTLDAGVQLMLATRERMAPPPPESQTVDEARAFMREEAAIARGRAIKVGAVGELEVPGAHGPLRARHYVPPAEPGGPHPLLVFFHGGGFVAGDLDTHDAPCRALCRHAGVHVLSVDYRLAPEHPFPEYVDDVLVAWRWAAEHAGDLGADPARVAVGGDSAGGNLSAVIAIAAARGEVPEPALQVLIYPATDAAERHRSRDLFSEGFFLTDAVIDWYEGHFMPPGNDPGDWRRSPLRAPDLSGVAPAIVVTAGFDPLRDEGEAFGEALRAAGVPVVVRRHAGLFHGFLNTGGIHAASRAAVLELAGMVRAMLHVAPAAVARSGEAESTAAAQRDAA